MEHVWLLEEQESALARKNRCAVGQMEMIQLILGASIMQTDHIHLAISSDRKEMYAHVAVIMCCVA
jgi:hypothetical protein